MTKLTKIHTKNKLKLKRLVPFEWVFTFCFLMSHLLLVKAAVDIGNMPLLQATQQQSIQVLWSGSVCEIKVMTLGYGAATGIACGKDRT